MKKLNNALVLLIKFFSRRITGRAGYLLVLAGIAIISPPLIIYLINLYLEVNNLEKLAAPESTPAAGWVMISLGFILIVINHFWIPKQKHKEVIGIRHNSLGAFPKEDLRKDMPLLQQLETYREIDVDHSDSYANGLLDDHRSVIRRLDKVPQELGGLLGSASGSSIAYYGLPHVPLAFYLGYLLSDNKFSVDLYELGNQSRRWNRLTAGKESLDVDSTLDQITPSDATGDIVIAIGISYPVHQTEIDELDLPDILATVEINAHHPQREVIANMSQVEKICTEFRRALEETKNRFPNRQRIHLFYAGPVSLCFALGQCISERIDPEITVYNFSAKSRPRYAWSLTLNSPEALSATFSSHVPQGADNASVQYA
ncbi:SAVED domain-containing protein [Marinimicrobium sp. ABcell2]|uniref:SAVED domain-containing protein n=1 Tax=Marinimicrobium sp. ABcell2 TaxID=3069751 RepID=UPI0027B6DB93|nr:SAVED domain-containing protein [Marinimicrobium sp. ABcell2]MDQ2075164.1 SAVED domain-containing protein [Marinimicrobium sp. ABcell2]